MRGLSDEQKQEKERLAAAVDAAHLLMVAAHSAYEIAVAEAQVFAAEIAEQARCAYGDLSEERQDSPRGRALADHVCAWEALEFSDGGLVADEISTGDLLRELPDAPV